MQILKILNYLKLIYLLFTLLMRKNINKNTINNIIYIYWL